MKLTSESFADQTAIPGRCAFAVKHPDTHVQFSDNRNPQLTWSDAPQGTLSFALLCVDPDGPSKPDDVNQDGRTVPADLPRAQCHGDRRRCLQPGCQPAWEVRPHRP